MGGASSKQVFSNNINKLLTTDADSSDHEFWDDLWKASITIEEIFEVVTPDLIRTMITKHPGSLRTLFTQAVAQLYQVVETPYPVYFDQALNCARILTRILPFMLEINSGFVKEIFWSRQLLTSPATSSTEESKETDPNVEFSEDDLKSQEFKNALMWAPGVGSVEKSVVASTQYDKNRVDILRLMIAAFSDALFQSPDSYDSCSSMWLEVATSVDAPYAEIVFASLMNTVLGYDPIGWGLPYGNLVATDTAKPLMESAVHVLVILLDYGNPMALSHADMASLASSRNDTAPHVQYVASEDTDAPGFNVFRRILGKIDSPDQLNFIFRGFVRLLNNVHEWESSYLPFSTTRVDIEQELLVLLWKCFEEIPKFMAYVLRSCDVTELMIPICYFMLEGRKDPSKVGMMYLCTFMLLKLSGERNFGVALNKPYQLQLPVDIPIFSGNHTDLLIIVLHKMIVSGSDALASLYNCFLTIICNVSPYCKCLCTVSAVKLVNLFQLFTSPRFLYAAEANHVYVSMILETFNNIIQYQYEGNVNVIYAVVRRKELFEKLASLTLRAAIKNAEELGGGNKQGGDQARKGGAASSSTTTSRTGKKGKTTGNKKPTAEIDGTEHDQNNITPPVASNIFATSKVHERHAQPDDAREGVATTRTATDDSEMSPGACPPSDAAIDQAVAQVEAAAKEAPLHLVHTDEETKEYLEEEQAGKIHSTVGNVVPEVQYVPPVADAPSQTDEAHTPPPAAQQAVDVKFVPTEAWLEAVKSDLPLNTVMRLLKHLVPLIEELGVNDQIVDELQVVEFIQRTTMVGLLPVPHPIVIRKYQPNKYTCLWFTAFLWGVIFMHNQALPMFDGKRVKLFIVQSMP